MCDGNDEKKIIENSSSSSYTRCFCWGFPSRKVFPPFACIFMVRACVWRRCLHRCVSEQSRAERITRKRSNVKWVQVHGWRDCMCVCIRTRLNHKRDFPLYYSCCCFPGPYCCYSNWCEFPSPCTKEARKSALAIAYTSTKARVTRREAFVAGAGMEKCVFLF